MWASGAPVRTRPTSTAPSVISQENLPKTPPHTNQRKTVFDIKEREPHSINLHPLDITLSHLCKEKSQPKICFHICWKARTTFARARPDSPPVPASGQNLESARSLLGPSHHF